MADTTLPALLGAGDHASRPAAGSVGSGALYACSDHTKLYQSDGSTWSDWFDPTALGGGSAADLAADRVILTGGDITTSSGTFVDATGLSLTISTGARRVLLGFAAQVYNNNNAGAVFLTFAVDGTDQGDATLGIVGIGQHATATEGMNGSFTYLTDVLSAGSHTFKVRFHRGSAGTATIAANSPDASFYAVELYAD